MNQNKPSYLNFKTKDYPWKPDVDYRKYPELYKVGKGEQGVLICEPYKSEIDPYWRFKTELIAKESSQKIYLLFLEYLKNNDFIGADMARKYLQMGFTRARRYFNYKGGQKYDTGNDYNQLKKGTGDPEKAKSAEIFYQKWIAAENNKQYAALKTAWKKTRG
ncbi:DUF4385 domain-containing protein [Epilithonimonas zeae]|uniref:DUF4385 domain-containing protein n=1 Tax=Epilithonimonas zeae TaxID=1416779 RepID=UPI00200C3D44|nr:DUF4385 domain-containing protein [Epilithonimonas zeae]UQB69838.1 DUF4385 domain-containing protein [Epilithonimonas zeae]